MNTKLIPALALVALASQATAQTSASRSSLDAGDLGRPGRFDIVLTPSAGSVSSPFNNSAYDQSGVGIDAQFHLPSVFFLKAGFKSYSDGNAYTFGLGVAIPAGNGRVTLGLDGTTLDIRDWGFEPQASLRAAYEYNFAFGLKVGAGVTQFLNPSIFGDDVTAPHLTVGYSFTKLIGLDITFSSEDAILGLPDSDGSFNAALRFTF